jgi:hypothetical protein
MHRRGPEYDLAEVSACLSSGNVLVAAQTATHMIDSHFRAGGLAAEVFARRVVSELVPGNFSRTVQLRDGTLADEYGIVVDGKSWYVKLRVRRTLKRLDIISCHLPDRDIPTSRGIVTCTHHGTRPYE